MKHVPDWFPGTGFKKIGRQWAAELNIVNKKPYDFVKHQMAQGRAQDSFLARLIEAGDETPLETFTNKWSTLILYLAGADTVGVPFALPGTPDMLSWRLNSSAYFSRQTVASLCNFFLAMMLHPEVQRKAQEEIDRVIGENRLPLSADRENLPFVDAVVKEALRWHAVAPMSLPHTSTEDDVYGGYFIPKEAIIMTNIW